MKLFDLDGPLWKALSLFANLVFLNVLFLVFSLPVITMGASWCALCGCTQDLIEGKDGKIIRMFFRLFREHFAHSTVLWILCAIVIGLLYYYNYVIAALGNEIGKSYRIAFFVLCILFLFGFFYLFPLEAKYGFPVKKTIAMAWQISVLALPWTLLALVVTLGLLFVCFVMNPAMTPTMVYIWIVFGFAFLAYVTNIIYLKAFKKIIL